MPSKEVMSLLRESALPHIWCAGCGHGIVLHSLLRAMVDLKLDPTKTVMTSGIGCSSRIPGYVNVCSLHTTHGRSLAFATGVKLANPELTVIAAMGDGDCAAIGGNHFIHACRRNIDICAIVMNNNIYGMTGGQASPTTPEGAMSTTSPYGQLEPQFDLCKLAVGAGATYVARTTVAQPKAIEGYIKKGIQKKGFAVIEVVTYCHTQFGRKNRRPRPIDNIEWLRNNSVPISKAKEMSEEELRGKIVVGEFVDIERPEYVERYLQLVEQLGGRR